MFYTLLKPVKFARIFYINISILAGWYKKLKPSKFKLHVLRSVYISIKMYRGVENIGCDKSKQSVNLLSSYNICFSLEI